MSDDPRRYPRRDFLCQCGAMPLATSLLTSGESVAADGQPAPVFLPKPSRKPEAELAREVESLLQFVDPSMRHRYVPIDAAKNAWPVWIQAHEVHVPQPEDDEFQESIDKLSEKASEVRARVRQRIVDWIDRNEPCRKLIDQGIARGAVEHPRTAKSVWLSLPDGEEMGAVRRLARLKAVTCDVRLIQRDVPGAAREASSILTMGKMLMCAECMLVDYLIAQVVVNIGALAVCHAATAQDTPDDQARAAIGSLESAKTTSEDLMRAYRVELCRWFLPIIASLPNQATHRELVTHYFFDSVEPDYQPDGQCLQAYKRCIEQITILLEGHPHPLDKEATIRLSSALHLRYGEQVNRPWLKRDRNLLGPLQKELAAWPAEVQPDMLTLAGLLGDADQPRKLTEKELRQAGKALRTVDNVFGKFLVVQSTSTILGIPTLEINQARVEAARIRIALRLYEKRHGRLPAQLDDLVKDGQLPEVPQDPFNGEPFRYSAERRVLWCVGQEGANKGIIPDQQDPDNLFDENVEQTWPIKAFASQRNER